MATCPGIAQANVLPQRQGQSSQTWLNETLPSAASASAKSELQQKKERRRRRWGKRTRKSGPGPVAATS